MKQKVLVVEDSPLIGLFLRDALEVFGFEVMRLCPSISAAYDEMEQNGLPDVGILDIFVEDGKTYSLAEQLVFRNVPVLLMSGIDVSEAPAFITLQKPYSIDQLRVMLHRVLGDRDRTLVDRCKTLGLGG